jgi:hypothetical protein
MDPNAPQLSDPLMVNAEVMPNDINEIKCIYINYLIKIIGAVAS